MVYDMILAFLFFLVILSPLAIHACLNLAERLMLKRAAARAAKKGPRSAWTSEAAPSPRVSSATPSVR
jgi:hypothetical protein